MRLVAVDPGKTTGIATVIGGQRNAWQAPVFQALQGIDVLFSSWAEEEPQPAVLVVCESFVPRPGVRTWQPDALEAIGVLRFLCLKFGYEFELQSPADAKRFSTDEKLRRLGWYDASPGGHVNDSLRHLLLLMVRHRLIDMKELTEDG